MNVISRLKEVQGEIGWGLLLLRSPRVLWRSIATALNTCYWRFFVGSMGKHVRISPGVVIHKPRNVFMDDYVVISEGTIIGSESKTGRLYIQKHVQINRMCFIDHSGDTTIGAGTMISEGASLLSHSHGYNPRQPSVGIPKQVGMDCWIGYRATISENATVIGEHVIIATGSMVTKSCERPHSIYGGCPAKWLKSIEDVA